MSIAPLAAGEDVQIPFGAEITQDEAAAMLRAIFNLFMRWGVPDSEGRILLGQPSRRTYARWKSGKISSVPHDIKQRLSYLMGIHKSVRYMFKDAERSYLWMKKPNVAFNGQSALQRMLAGDVTDLAIVRGYLDSERSGW